jgi:hypothetical protein
MSVSLSSISLSILPISSCGPMYCPGLSGDGSGSMGRGRSGSGRLGRSNEGRHGLSFLRFQVFHCPKAPTFRVGNVGGYCFETTFRSKTRVSLCSPSDTGASGGITMCELRRFSRFAVHSCKCIG